MPAPHVSAFVTVRSAIGSRDGSRWRGPALGHGFDAAVKNGPAASELRRRCACMHHGSGRKTHRIQGCGSESCLDSGLPSTSSSRPSRRDMCAQAVATWWNRILPAARSHQSAAVLGAVKVWPGNGGVCRTDAATANLDSPCARRRRHPAVGARESLRRGRTREMLEAAAGRRFGRRKHQPHRFRLRRAR